MSNSGLIPPHHVGLVVSDLDAAMNGYGKNFGYSFYQFEVDQGNASLSPFNCPVICWHFLRIMPRFTPPNPIDFSNSNS